MLNRILLLVFTFVLLIVAAPVPNSEVIRARTPTEDIDSIHLDLHDVSRRSPVIEPVPIAAVVVDTRDAEPSDEEEVEAIETSEVDARGLTKSNGNSGRGITKPKGNGGRSITKPNGNSGRGITKPKGNVGRGITKPKGNAGRGITKPGGNGGRSITKPKGNSG